MGSFYTSGIKADIIKWKGIHDFLYVHNRNQASISEILKDIHRKCLLGSFGTLGTKADIVKWKGKYDFLYVRNTNQASISDILGDNHRKYIWGHSVHLG